jgi:hypothetical protein
MLRAHIKGTRSRGLYTSYFDNTKLRRKEAYKERKNHNIQEGWGAKPNRAKPSRVYVTVDA